MRLPDRKHANIVAIIQEGARRMSLLQILVNENMSGVEARRIMVRKGFPPAIINVSMKWITEAKLKKGIEELGKNNLIVLCGDETEEKLLYGGMLLYYFWMNSHNNFRYVNGLDLEDDLYQKFTVSQVFMDDFDKTLGFKNRPRSEAIVSEVIRNGGKAIVNVYTIDKLLGTHGAEFVKKFDDKVSIIECPRAPEITWKGVKL